MAINVANFERQTTILQNTNTILDELAQGLGKTPRRQIFTSNGSWTAPPGVTNIFVTGGGGGGGGSVYAGTATTGSPGGITSFGTLLSMSGGGGGASGPNIIQGVGGTSGGLGGQSGGVMITATNGVNQGAEGGSAGPFKGGMSTTVTATSEVRNGGYCSGGGAGAANGAAGAGGSGDFVTNFPLTVVPGTTYSITIGEGGIGGAQTSAIAGGNGGPGILIIDWWE